MQWKGLVAYLGRGGRLGLEGKFWEPSPKMLIMVVMLSVMTLCGDHGHAGCDEHVW